MLEAGRVKAQGPSGTLGTVLITSFSATEVKSHGRETPDDDRPLPGYDETREESVSGEGAVSWSVVKGYLLDMGFGWFWAMVFVGFIA